LKRFRSQNHAILSGVKQHSRGLKAKISDIVRPLNFVSCVHSTGTCRVQHKRESCTVRRSWGGVYGGGKKPHSRSNIQIFAFPAHSLQTTGTTRDYEYYTPRTMSFTETNHGRCTVCQESRTRSGLLYFISESSRERDKRNNNY
jgi:hypothetical protein